MNKDDFRRKAEHAVQRFWAVRDRQQNKQGSASGKKDAGNRGAVTGGAQLDGIVEAVAGIISEARIDHPCIYFRERGTTHLPGFYRPTKSWDVVVVANGHLIACVEFKSQVGSFGNNFNNRTEEAIGSATDFWTAYREGAFAGSPRPWLGYFMLLEKNKKSTSPVRVREPHFPVFKEFRHASYAKRYELLCLKLVRERLYDATCLVLSDREQGREGQYDEPNEEVGFMTFATSLYAHALAHAPEVNANEGPSRHDDGRADCR